MADENKETNEDEKLLVSDTYTTEERLKQKEEIEAEINKKPLIGWLEKGVDTLFEEFKANPNFMRKLPNIGLKYSGLRRVRELMLQDKALFTAVKTKVDTSLAYLLEVGYEEVAVEFFVDEAKAFFAEKFPKNEVEKDEFFASKEQSIYLVWFMRLLAAGYIKHHWAERFSFFAGEMYTSAEDYCGREVEPSDKECEQIAVISVCEFFEVRTCVEYLDQNPGADETSTYFFGPGKDGDPARIHLLYRPGHYDILYPK